MKLIGWLTLFLSAISGLDAAGAQQLSQPVTPQEFKLPRVQVGLHGDPF